MKNKLLLTCISLFSLSIFSASAQIETKIGGLVAYGTEIENVGIGVNAEFGILENLSISPSFIYYLPKESGPLKMNWWELNGNANYYFTQDESFNFYGLAGINYTHTKLDFDDAYANNFMTGASDGNVGINLGAGANFSIGSSIIPFAEVKYVVMDAGQLVIAGGVKFNL